MAGVDDFLHLSRCQVAGEWLDGSADFSAEYQFLEVSATYKLWQHPHVQAFDSYDRMIAGHIQDKRGFEIKV